jgi:hypothetical protein
MKRKDFIKNSTACGVLSLLSLELLENQLNAQTIKTNSANTVNDANREQITKLLKFVDSEMNSSTKQKVFGKLGYECFHCTNAEKWIKSMNSDSLIEFVNNGKSNRWERIEYDPEKQILKVIGRKVSCDCAYSQCQQPPISCKGFMKEFFGTLFEKKVYVTIDESVILGGDRCSSTIIIN